MSNRVTRGEALVGQLTTEVLSVSGATTLDDITAVDITASGTINLGDPVAFIADPTGGTATPATDAQARAAIVSILDALDAVGIMAAS